LSQHKKQSIRPSESSVKVVRCAIYTRKSTEEGLDQDFNSLDAQRESAEAYITSQKNEGWVCMPDRYDDGGFTGGNIERPALKRLLVDVEAGRLDCIVVYKVDRLSRSLMDFSRVMEALERNGVSFVSVTQQFNTTHSMGRLTLNILLSFAQFEREIIAERTRDKMTAARKKGKWIGGAPVLGYDVDQPVKRLVINDAEAFRVRAIFELYLERQSLLSTAQELNGRGWTTKRWQTKKGRIRGGQPFNKTNLSRLVTNPLYIGQIFFKGEYYTGEHPAIVKEEIWRSTEALLQRNSRDGGKTVRNKHGALLKGILYCVSCNSAMVHACTSKDKKTTYRYYVCSHAQKNGWDSCPTKSTPAAEIESFVIERIRGIGRDADLMAEAIHQARQQVEEQIGRLENEQSALQQELKRHAIGIRNLVDSGLSHRESAVKIAELENRISKARRRTEQIQDELTGLRSGMLDEGEFKAALESFNPIWDSLTRLERTRLIHLLVERIGYDGAKGLLRITFRPNGIKTLAQEAMADAKQE